LTRGEINLSASAVVPSSTSATLCSSDKRCGCQRLILVWVFFFVMASRAGRILTEDDSAHLLEDLNTGKITVSDLMVRCLQTVL
jgi:hypothetical protein